MPWKFFIRLTTDLLIIWTVFAYTFFITIISNLNCFCPYFLYYNHLARQVSSRSDCSFAEKTKLQQTTWLNFMFYPSMHACFIYCLYYSVKYDYIFFKHYNQSSSFSTLYIIHLCKEKVGKITLQTAKFLSWPNTHKIFNKADQLWSGFGPCGTVRRETPYTGSISSLVDPTRAFAEKCHEYRE